MDINVDLTNIDTAIQSLLGRTYSFRLNTVTGRYEFKGGGDAAAAEEWRPLDDREIYSMLLECRKIPICKMIGKSRITECIENKYMSPAANPFESYFNTLHGRWDRVDRITGLARLFKCDQDLMLFYLQKWLTGVVAQSMPGDGRNDLTLVLVGRRQGQFKTSFFRVLAARSVGVEYFHETAIIPGTKEANLAIATNFLVMIDEISEKDVNKLKRFITMGGVKHRFAYDKYESSLARHASICATTNERYFLNDIYGNRRWLAIEIEDFNVPGFMRLDIDQLWSQALYLFENPVDFPYWLDDSQISIVNKSNEQFRATTPEEELLLDYYQPEPDENTAQDRLSATEIVLKISPSTGSVRLSPITLGKIMGSLGFRSVKVRGRTKYLVHGVSGKQG